jgi:ubiquinone/menaquinone biosynthesis C-methylase UbiE
MEREKAKGQLVAGRQAQTYNYRGPLWGRIKAKHVSLVNPRPKQRVLDVGCGTGKTLWLLRQKCDPSVELCGLEPSKDMYKQAKSYLGSQARLVQGVAQELPYPDNSFDWVISTQVLHHLAGVEKKKMLAEMYRVLKPGGTVVVSDWGRPATPLGRFLDFLWHKHAFVKENASILSPTTFRGLGFRNITEEPLQFGIVHHIRGTKT